MVALQANPELVKKINRIFHDIEAECYEETHPEIYAVEAARWQELYRRVCPQGAPRTILDIGTGNGFVPHALQSLIAETDEVIFSDLSEKMLAHVERAFASARFKKRFLLVDASHTGLPDASVDVITLNSVLHHIPDYPEAFVEFDRILKPGGVILIRHEPNSRFAGSYVLRTLFKVVTYLRNRNYTSLGEPTPLERQVRSALSKEGIDFPPDTPFASIQALVDIESPTGGGDLDTARGFDPWRLQTQYFATYVPEVITTYNYLVKLDDSKTFIRRMLASVLRTCYPDRGYFFDFVIRKPKA